MASLLKDLEVVVRHGYDLRPDHAKLLLSTAKVLLDTLLTARVLITAGWGARSLRLKEIDAVLEEYKEDD